MSNNPKKIVPSSGVLRELALRIKLILRLMADKRVNPFVKAIPVASLVYLINPFDIPTPIDDIGVVWFGMYLFMELCPPEVVAEHMKNLKNINLEKNPSNPDADVVDVEFEEEK